MAKKILVDPAKLERASTQMNAQAGDYEQQYKQLFSEVNAMGAAWKGADNKAFVDQIAPFEEDFKAMKALMLQYAEFLKISAGNYKTTQSSIADQARKLTN